VFDLINEFFWCWFFHVVTAWLLFAGLKDWSCWVAGGGCCVVEIIVLSQ
jgi:hypothetical protein